jgi:hypothetical protein
LDWRSCCFLEAVVSWVREVCLNVLWTFVAQLVGHGACKCQNSGFDSRDHPYVCTRDSKLIWIKVFAKWLILLYDSIN